MSTKDNPKPSRVWRFFKLFSDLITPTNVMILAGLTFVLITGVFGGWEAAKDDTEGTTTIKVGDRIDAAPFSLTVHQALWTSDVSPIIAGFGDTTFFVVRATVVNTDSQPVPAHVLGDSVTARILETDLTAQSGLWSNAYTDDGSMGQPTAYRAIDTHNARALQPGLEQEYWLVWELPPDTPRSNDITLEFYSHVWRASSLDGGLMWADRTPVALTQLSGISEGQVS